jgi:hypothetical protein
MAPVLEDHTPICIRRGTPFEGNYVVMMTSTIS